MLNLRVIWKLLRCIALLNKVFDCANWVFLIFNWVLRPDVDNCPSFFFYWRICKEIWRCTKPSICQQVSASLMPHIKENIYFSFFCCFPLCKTLVFTSFNKLVKFGSAIELITTCLGKKFRYKIVNTFWQKQEPNIGLTAG